MRSAELSIIIPTLNEEEALPLLLGDLSGQQDLSIEVIIADGGSKDRTEQVAKDFFAKGPLPGVFLSGQPGRGRQLNVGAAAAQSDWLLFLHADSRLLDTCQLRKAIANLKEIISVDDDRVAGRFKLRFDTQSGTPSFGYYYYEAKAALGRPGCIHGDQGMLLTRKFFYEIGPFREDLPVMEDTSFAEKLRKRGRWCLLPGEIVTSARRFQAEGMMERQTLNALMMNFLSIGWPDFFASAPEIYRQQVQAGPLKLKPFFTLILELLRQMPFRKRLELWLATGRYVRSQAWQIGLMLDCQQDFKTGKICSSASSPWLSRFDSWFEPLTNHRLGHFLTAVLVRAWFEYRLRCG